MVKANKEHDKLVYSLDVSELFDFLEYDLVSNEWQLFTDESCVSKYSPNMMNRVHHIPHLNLDFQSCMIL